MKSSADDQDKNLTEGAPPEEAGTPAALHEQRDTVCAERAENVDAQLEKKSILVKFIQFIFVLFGLCIVGFILCMVTVAVMISSSGGM